VCQVQTGQKQEDDARGGGQELGGEGVSFAFLATVAGRVAVQDWVAEFVGCGEPVAASGAP
jgi:hypothetical protein